MATSRFCPGCGSKLETGPSFCSACGAKQGVPNGGGAVTLSVSHKSALTAFLLCLFFGSLGIHRFYVGKIGTGILMLLTGGGFGLWTLYDLITIVCNNFTDSDGAYLELTRNPSAAKTVLMVVGALFFGFIIFAITIVCAVFFMLGGVSQVAFDEMDALRAGDINKAYSYTSHDFQKGVSVAEFQKFVEHYPILKNNDSASFPNREVKNGVGTLKGTLRAKDGSETGVQVELIKENNGWKIESIDLKPARAGVKVDSD